MFGSIVGSALSSPQSAPAAKPDETRGPGTTAPAERPPASSPRQAEQPRQAQPAAAPPPEARAEQSPPPPPARATPAPSATILSASTALVPVETPAPAAAPASDALADDRAALATITDTAQNWGKGGTVLDAAVAFSSKSAEESGAAPDATETLPATTGRTTEESARTLAAEQGYSASKSLYEGPAPQGETSKAA